MSDVAVGVELVSALLPVSLDLVLVVDAGLRALKPCLPLFLRLRLRVAKVFPPLLGVLPERFPSYMA